MTSLFTSVISWKEITVVRTVKLRDKVTQQRMPKTIVLTITVFSDREGLRERGVSWPAVAPIYSCSVL